ncbi:MAG TPA: prepilin-type N-terminal cleavage/methylation domain-containing protein [Longimicrobiaceae bacterium]|nr:prepilin-type N-terminal cleavage/methylation domain-containing protein [Longimicrobiaceae bacterium]
MTTDRAPATGEGGFTLIEVMIAMVILAVGLLGLEALGVGASRMVSRAERQGALVAVASDTLERTLSRIRTAASPAALPDVSHAFLTSRRDTIRVSVTGAGTRLRTVSVTAVPSPSSAVLRRADSLRVTGNVFQ